MNVLTERERCARRCAAVGFGKEPWHPVGESRLCEHGRWWVATDREVQDRYFRWFQVWRPATWGERRRAKQAQRSHGASRLREEQP